MPARHYLVTGHVQGVYFRQSTQARAHEIGVQGWVKNLPSGQVECVAMGSDAQLQMFEAWLAQGPPQAHVLNVTVQPYTASVSDQVVFSVRRS